MIYADRSNVDVAKFLVDAVPLEPGAFMLQSFDDLCSRVISDDFFLIVVIVEMADEDQVSGNVGRAIRFARMRIKSDTGSFCRQEIEEGLAVPPDGHRAWRVG